MAAQSVATLILGSRIEADCPRAIPAAVTATTRLPEHAFDRAAQLLQRAPAEVLDRTDELERWHVEAGFVDPGALHGRVRPRRLDRFETVLLGESFELFSGYFSTSSIRLLVGHA